MTVFYYISKPHLTYPSPTDGHLGCFRFGTTINYPVMNICVYSLDTHAFIFLGINLGVELQINE